MSYLLSLSLFFVECHVNILYNYRIFFGDSVIHVINNVASKTAIECFKRATEWRLARKVLVLK